MNLLDHTHSALDFTRRLEAALALDDLQLCQEILELRGEAMARFEHAHRQAGDQELTACRTAIRELADADRQVQTRMAEALAATARDFRENLVSSNHGSAGQSYASTPAQACIDRKA